jgi:DNA recombination protein RmuC
LDKSGLQKDIHYIREASGKGAEGNRLRPDVIINLPENKHLVIDSKLSLVDYERYSSMENDAEKQNALKLHTNSVKKHIAELCEKNYAQIHGINTPDFTLMFIPIEPAFHAAIESDPELFANAYEKNIVLTSPSTLIPTLKIIHNIWRQENQNRNAIEIAKAGAALYDKFIGFLENMKKIGESIDKSKNIYDEAMGQLSTGRGNLVKAADKMRLLGIKPNKKLPIDFIQSEDE